MDFRLKNRKIPVIVMSYYVVLSSLEGSAVSYYVVLDNSKVVLCRTT